MREFFFTKTSSPDFSGSDFYVKHDREFDEELYERAYGLKPPRDVCKKIQKAVDDLQQGEWLQIIHSREE